MSNEPMSERAKIAERLAEIVRLGNLDQAHASGGASKITRGPRSIYQVQFFKPGLLDGVIEVFGPKFIRVAWGSRIRIIPATGVEVFNSPEDVGAFMQAMFIDYDPIGADAVPRRPHTTGGTAP